MLRCLFIVMFALISTASQALAERRVALVVGNSSYKHAPRLPNPVMDAEAVAAMLKRQGFEVILGIDVDRDGFFSVIDRFGEAARGAQATLFYYAGHGLQIDGKNLLVPVEARLKSELDAKRNTVEVDLVLNQTMGDAKVRIVLLDACRENPFATDIAADQRIKTRSVTVKDGLAEMRPGEGTIIQFATAAGALALDGKEGEHSPFTRAILANLTKPDVEIQHALTLARAQITDETRRGQQPWYSTNITGFFYMDRKGGSQLAALPVSEGPTGAPPPAGDASAAQSQKEILFWESIKTSRNADDFKAYLDQFPNGTYAGLARNRIREMTEPRTASLPAAASDARGIGPGTPIVSPELRTAEASLATEDAIGLNRDQWRNVQRRVAALGHMAGGRVDGKPGDGTRRGLRSWQNARAYPSTGYLNKLQYDALLAEHIDAAALARVDKVEDEDEKPTAQRPARTAQPRSGGASPQSSGGDAAGAAGRLIGGVLREVTKGKLPF